MPNALAIANVTRHNLKSLPEAWVEIKRMTFGQKLERQGMTKLNFELNKASKDLKGEMDMANKIAVAFEFKNCIVAHNLTDENDVTLNLAEISIISLLDPRVGEEINSLISDINNFEEDSGN